MNAVFTGLALRTLDASAFTSCTTGEAGDEPDRIIYESDGNLFFDSDGTGAAAAVLFAQLSPNLALTSEDMFIL